MVEYTLELDNVFASLADQTRRDMLRRLVNKRLTVGQLASQYNLSFAAVSKHLKVLEKAKLITKQRRGKHQIVTIYPKTLRTADDYLKLYTKLWETRLDSLENYLKASKE